MEEVSGRTKHKAMVRPARSRRPVWMVFVLWFRAPYRFFSPAVFRALWSPALKTVMGSWQHRKCLTQCASPHSHFSNSAGLAIWPKYPNERVKKSKAMPSAIGPPAPRAQHEHKAPRTEIHQISFFHRHAGVGQVPQVLCTKSSSQRDTMPQLPFAVLKTALPTANWEKNFGCQVSERKNLHPRL